MLNSDNPRGRLAALTVVSATATLLLGACGGGTSSDAPSNPPSGAPAASTGAGASPTGTAARPSSPPNQKVSLTDAGAKAEKKVPGGTLISIETEHDGAVWEVQVAAENGVEHEFDVDATSGAVTSSTVKHEDAADEAKHRARVKAADVGYRRAARLLRSAVPGGRLVELNLDDYRGSTVWEGDLRDAKGVKHAVKIDAKTGEVVAKHGDHDD